MLARWREYGVMPTLEERVAYLEGRVGEHTLVTDGLRTDIAILREEMNRRFEQVDKRFDQVDGRFTWLIGLQMAGLIATFSAIIGLYFK